MLVGRDRWMEFAIQPVNQSVSSRFSKRPVSNTKMEKQYRKTPDVDLWPLHDVDLWLLCAPQPPLHCPPRTHTETIHTYTKFLNEQS